MLTDAPFYIFDAQLAHFMKWNDFIPPPPSAAASRSPAAPTLYMLPSLFTSILDFSSHQAQFFLGPAGSGAPFHFHCPAINLLVYGKKR